MRKFFLALSIAVAPAWADFDAGMSAYRVKDYERALAEFQASAIEGHETAQFNLGVLYYRGEGVEKDLVKAFGWIELATQRGDPDFVEAQEVLILLMTHEQISGGYAWAGGLATEHGLRYTPPESVANADSVLAVSDR